MPWRGGVTLTKSQMKLLKPEKSSTPNLSNYLNQSAIILGLKGQNKKEILMSLAKGIAAQTDTIDENHFVKNLVSRENMKTTGIGHNVAFPHMRTPEVKKTYVSIGISEKGLPFDAMDNEPVNLFFLVVSLKIQISNRSSLLHNLLGWLNLRTSETKC